MSVFILMCDIANPMKRVGYDQTSSIQGYTVCPRKRRALKTTDKFGAMPQSSLNNVPLFTFLIATLFTYH